MSQLVVVVVVVLSLNHDTINACSISASPAGVTHLFDFAELLLHLVVNSLGLHLLLLSNRHRKTMEAESQEEGQGPVSKMRRCCSSIESTTWSKRGHVQEVHLRDLQLNRKYKCKEELNRKKRYFLLSWERVMKEINKKENLLILSSVQELQASWTRLQKESQPASASIQATFQMDCVSAVN